MEVVGDSLTRPARATSPDETEVLCFMVQSQLDQERFIEFQRELKNLTQRFEAQNKNNGRNFNLNIALYPTMEES